MKLRFLWIGETRDANLLQLEEKYLERLQRFSSVERVSVPELSKRDPRQTSAQMAREARLLQKKLGRCTCLICLDESGRQLTSRDVAAFLEERMNRGVSEITFLVGGYLGTPQLIKERAHENWALSRMTLPHELARIVLLEQVYRAACRVRGRPYHK
ncbi:MAG: 23S rRNA (pseudouridine(1915)-N(3))-methyltransferase RlmH [Acidobacteriota bacterium]